MSLINNGINILQSNNMITINNINTKRNSHSGFNNDIDLKTLSIHETILLKKN